MTGSIHPEIDAMALVAKHRELMSGECLRRALGYRSERSFLRAVQAGTVPVAVVGIPHRRGRFARTRDVARWLASLGSAQN